ncbi:MAG: hypothetical protein JW797_07625 [Bradymonadales bacterium]|nr:hypothetical protein [Bradymonadales bacterium]
MRYLDGKVQEAIRRFALIRSGDRILVATSGGKDSWCLLEILAARRAWVRESYLLTACHLAIPGCTDGRQREALERRCAELEVPLIVVQAEAIRTETKAEGSSQERGRMPSGGCFHCAWERRRLLFETAADRGCNLVALGHHADDLVETFLMNLFVHGELSTMQPRREFFDGRLTVIRPLVLVEEKTLGRLARHTHCPLQDGYCPLAVQGQRARIKALIAELSRQNRALKRNLLRLALETVDGPICRVEHAE